MSGPERPRSWTEQQQAAFTPAGFSVALSAGAGCGKTAVLTERFLRSLDGPDGCALGAIVALTFTEKAARELRGRVRQACRARMEQAVEAARWGAILRGLEAAPIGTFHSFCAELLRRFPIEAGVEPGFDVAEETIAPALRDDALAACTRGWLARCDRDLIDLAVDLGLTRATRQVAELMQQRSRGDLAAWARCEPEQVVALWESRWPEARRRVVLDRVAAAFGPLEPLLAERGRCPEVMRARLNDLDELRRRISGEPDPAALLGAMNEPARVQGVKASSWDDPDLYERARAALEGFRKALKAIGEGLQPDPDASLEAARQGRRLARLALEALDAYDAAKRDAGLLDFEDLQLCTRALLRDPPEPVRRWLEASIARVLVDEFQDTDPVQAEIIRMVLGARLDGGRLFFVGDTKQSIYRFRGAQPGLFGSLRSELPAEGRLHLTRNFRSVPAILGFVNHLFGDIFIGPEHALEPGTAAPDGACGAAVEFHWAPPPQAEGRRGPPVDARRRAEAQALARRIRRMTSGAGWMVRDEADPRRRRPARPGDVVLLFRTLNNAAPYEAALADAGLDYHIVKGSAFFGQPEVLDLINLLALLEDPYDEPALAATLRSPFGCVSDAGLFWLANSKFGGLPEGFARWKEVSGLSPTDRLRAGRLHALLTAWRRDKDSLPIAGLLDRVLDESGFEAALPAEFLGDRRRANVRKLVRMARRFDAPGGFTLADFAARLRASYDDPPREPQAATTDEQGDAVRLMTIHQAKGLEFPVVILPDANRQENAARGDVALHPELGVIVRPPEELDRGEEAGPEPAGSAPKSLGWLLRAAEERREDEQEALRLCYVATTRARDVLILSAGMTPDEKAQSHALKLLDRRFERATGRAVAAAEGAPDASVVDAIADPAPTSRRPPSSLLRVARLLRKAPPPGEGAGEAPDGPARPPRVLDLDPAAWLGPRRGRLDRLFRAALAEDPVAGPDDPAAKARRAAARLGELVGAGAIDEVARRLGAWRDARAGREPSAARGRLPGASWSLAWPPEGPEPTVIRGRYEWAARDAQGRWAVGIVSDAAADEGRERLRLLLSARVLAERVGETVGRGCRCIVGEDGSIRLDSWFREADLAALLAAATGPRGGGGEDPSLPGMRPVP